MDVENKGEKRLCLSGFVVPPLSAARCWIKDKHNFSRRGFFFNVKGFSDGHHVVLSAPLLLLDSFVYVLIFVDALDTRLISALHFISL